MEDIKEGLAKKAKEAAEAAEKSKGRSSK